MAAMCSGVVPQQPPAMLRKPLFAKSSSSVPVTVLRPGAQWQPRDGAAVDRDVALSQRPGYAGARPVGGGVCLPRPVAGIASEQVVVNPSSVIVQRALFDELGGFDERFFNAEDVHLWLRLARLAALPAIGHQQLAEFHANFWGTARGQIAIVGDFDAALNRKVFDAELDFSISENPTLRFNFVPHGKGELTVPSAANEAAHRRTDLALARTKASEKAGIRPPKFQIETIISSSEKLTSGAPYGEGPDAALWADVKAKTAEKLGPVGQGQAIEARAVCLLAAVPRDTP